VLEPFERRILPFDAAAARRYADIAGRGARGPEGPSPLSLPRTDFIVASGDARAFDAAGLIVIDP